MPIKVLKDVDFKVVSGVNPRDDQIKAVVAICNRGLEHPLKIIQKDTSYGKAIIKHGLEVKEAMTPGASGEW